MLLYILFIIYGYIINKYKNGNVLSIFISTTQLKYLKFYDILCSVRISSCEQFFFKHYIYLRKQYNLVKLY